MPCEISERDGEVELILGPTVLEEMPLSVLKRIRIGMTGAGLRARYRLTWSGDAPLDGTWAVQLNLASPEKVWASPERKEKHDVETVVAVNP